MDKLSTLAKDFSLDNLESYLLEQEFTVDVSPVYDIQDIEEKYNVSDIKEVGYIRLKQEADLVVFAIKIDNLTERTSKKKQFDIAKKLLEKYQKFYGLFVFYDDSKNFRLSFVFKTTHGTKAKYSHYKRFTFYVSPDLTNKTFIIQLKDCNFTDLNSIKQAFSVEPITKEFYNELQNWYYYAMDQVKFPDDYKYSDDPEKDKEIRNAQSLIRLITRLIFIWFLKEKGLVPSNLFNEEELKKIIKDFGKGNNYYNAILQNLFFATLNKPIEERGWAEDKGFPANKKDFGVKSLYRYEDKLLISKEEVLKLFLDIPFINGGLFDCLDKDKVYIDGFSRNEKKQAKISDELFFSSKEKTADLSNYGLSKYAKVRGLIDILNSYNFTTDEATPIDQEIALDPELLGKVFENLLASYNPETQTTARKATGSYYTPREIVDYMVEESLREYLETKVPEAKEILDDLFSYSVEELSIPEDLRLKLIKAIDQVKIIDPACGSGAFPMGILHKLVFLLQKLDPKNETWKEIQLERASKEADAVFRSEKEKQEREKLLEEINENFDESVNYPDYARKLYLIENCIYGVDIQPIAIQISKLRFFISLILDQKVDRSKPNFGILTLPNLETKFISANTLIGLEKSLQKSLRNPEIERLEQELKFLRHRYFRIKSRAEKIQLQNEDRELREKLKKALIGGGWGDQVAEKIVKFDIFDQNASTDWFDPEWMFGVRDGFDIVIGNPPYIDSENMVRQGLSKEREYISKNYYFARGNWDIYIAFFEKGFELLNNKGILTFITPDKWLTKPFGEEMRKRSINKISSLVRCGRDVFESSNVDAIISIFSEKVFNNIIKIHESKNKKIIFKNSINKSILTPPYNLDFIFSDYLGLLLKIENVSFKLSDFGKCENACATSDAYKLKPLIKELKDKPFDKEIFLKVINTGTIGKYSSKWGKREMTYLGNKYVFPVVDKNEFIKTFNDTYKKRVFRPKIVIKGLTLLEACIDLEGLIIPGKSTLVVNAKDIPTLKLLLVIINSKLASFYLKEKYPSYTYNQGINFTKDMINSMPFPKISNEQQKLFVTLVDQILSIKKQNPEADTSNLEHQIDQLVYKLYGLTSEEIKIIEGGR
jgi:adenine-specific DNA-methyltransferase